MTPSWGREPVQSSSLSACCSFLIDTMTSSLPWKFYSPSCASNSIPGLQVPIKRDSHLSVSTEHRQLLKFLGSAVSAPGKPPLHQDHEALRDCALSPRAGGCLLLSGALSTNGLRPSHRLLLLLYPAEASSQLCGRLLRDQQPLLPASGGLPNQKGQASLC
ncbi:Beta-1,3-Galactosyl-O-Glycosyl-Glycoprotein Beta-1,6-N-Acetylglucosaminyltransferase 3 [Manis pentadactyla]|nr:Beta-1,3-Galactosyl-O-Glycosyl-Glycoprotein Beta-1,6-N-Acetylglucosaminyltransferase 3 [Manis pentadactyla]